VGGGTDLDELAGVCEGDAIRRRGRCHAHISNEDVQRAASFNMQRESRDAAVMRNVRQLVQIAITMRNARAVRRATRPRSMQPQYMQHATRYVYHAA
jgi:hypothetical protein